MRFGACWRPAPIRNGIPKHPEFRVPLPDPPKGVGSLGVIVRDAGSARLA